MICTWRSLGCWLAMCGLLTPIALRAEDLRFKLDDSTPASTAPAAGANVRVDPADAAQATYGQSDPKDVLDQPEILESDILLTNSAAPMPKPEEPVQTPTVASDASPSDAPASNALPSEVLASDAPASDGVFSSDPCVKCCCQQQRRWRPYAGVAATFLAPSHNTGGGSAILIGNYATGTTTLDRSATDRQMNISPRLWLGVQGENWGAVVRYWNWSSLVGGLSEPGAVLPVAGSAGSFTQNSLHLQTLDAEITRYLRANRSDVWFSIGFRYAAFQRSSSLMDTSRVGTTPMLINSSGMESTNFYGGGLTGGLFGKTPIGSSNLSWIYSGRMAVVWDPSSKSLAMSDVIYGGPFGINNFSGGTNSAFSTLLMSEIQLGMQYDRALKFVPGNAFFRTAFEWQYWNLNHGNSMTSAASGGLTPTTFPLGGFATAISRASGTTLDMLGFNLATGFNW